MAVFFLSFNKVIPLEHLRLELNCNKYFLLMVLEVFDMCWPVPSGKNKPCNTKSNILFGFI